MKAYKRLIIIGVVLIPFLVYLPIRVHVAYKPKVLEEKLAQKGCFYSSSKDYYQISGVDFGRGLSETVADLGLKKWYTKEKIDAIYKGLSGDSKSTYSDPFAVSAFDAKYSLTFMLSKYGNCYQISLMGAFVSEPKTPIPYYNRMDYGDACKFFYDLYNEFVASYGEPDITHFPIDLSNVTFDYNNRFSPEVYAYWITGEKGQQSVLGLSAKPYNKKGTKSTQVLDLNVYIDIGLEIEGITIADLTHDRIRTAT